MKGFIEVTRMAGCIELKLLVHYTTVYKEYNTWRHEGKILNISEEEMKELIKQAQL